MMSAASGAWSELSMPVMSATYPRALFQSLKAVAESRRSASGSLELSLMPTDRKPGTEG